MWGGGKGRVYLRLQVGIKNLLGYILDVSLGIGETITSKLDLVRIQESYTAGNIASPTKSD